MSVKRKPPKKPETLYSRSVVRKMLIRAFQNGALMHREHGSSPRELLDLGRSSANLIIREVDALVRDVEEAAKKRRRRRR